MEKEKIKSIDLFCGCGGISAGLKMAGCQILCGVDIEPKCITTFSHNFSEARSLLLDISEVPAGEFMGLVGIDSEELDLLVGGPPCQGFSKNVPRKFRYLDDPNNRLIKAFLDYCGTLKPKLILMENVAEMKNGFDEAYTEEILTCLSREGYAVNYTVLNSADYGIPQRRRRAFFLASRDGNELDLPPPTHFQPSRQMDLLPQPHHVTVWEAIGDLPSIKNGEGNEYCEYACPPFSEYQKLIRGQNKKVRNHMARYLKPTQYQRLASLQPGQGHKDLPKNLQVRGGYSGAYGRLTKDMIAPTITRWVFHPGSGRWGHPVDTRILTIREAARIQGFPDHFEFVGTYTQQAGQLGNAVPPLLIKIIAESIISQLGKSTPDNSFTNLSRDILSSSVGKLKVTT